MATWVSTSGRPGQRHLAARIGADVAAHRPRVAKLAVHRQLEQPLRARHRPDDPLADAHLGAGAARRIPAAGHGEEPLAALVGQEQHRVLEAEHPGHDLEHAAEQRLEIVGAVDADRERAQAAQRGEDLGSRLARARLRQRLGDARSLDLDSARAPRRRRRRAA
jgi:hypothetical protein